MVLFFSSLVASHQPQCSQVILLLLKRELVGGDKSGAY